MQTKTMEERQQILGQHVQAAVAAGYRIESQPNVMVVVVGGGEKRWVISVDEHGNVAKQQIYAQDSGNDDGVQPEISSSDKIGWWLIVGALWIAGITVAIARWG